MSGKVDVPEYSVLRTETPINVDGRLDDPAWEKAGVMELVDNVTGKPPRLPTTARMLYDDEWLYVGYHSMDHDIWGTMKRHDDPIYDEEVVEIFLDPVGLLTAYYELEVSPLNTRFDAFILNDAEVAGTDERGPRFQGFIAWDPIGFKHGVYVKGELNAHDGKAEFWECEMAIRFDELFLGKNLPPKPGDVWRGNLYRIDIEGKRIEESAFSPTGKEDFHVPSRFGKFVFK